MVRLLGARPDLGFQRIHGYERPLRDLRSLAHISETVCAADHVRIEHAHDDFELHYVLSGRGERSIAGEKHEVGAGDLVIVRPGERHAGRVDRRDPYHCFAIGFTPEVLPGARASGGDLTAVDRRALRIFDQRLVRGVAGVEHLVRRILAELDRVDDDPRERALTVLQIRASLLELLVLASRRSLGRPTATTARPPRRADFVALIDWARTRLHAPPAVREMAARVRLTPAHFTIAFKRETGRTPSAHLSAMRIDEAARRLVAEPDVAVTRVAFGMGFSSSQHFSRVFRRATGRTPTAWRRQHAAGS